jgi:hypothetical protein
LSFAIKMRKERSTKTKSLGNISSILSWLTVIAISYKQYGLLSFMPKIERFVAIPVSEHGLFCIRFYHLFLTWGVFRHL